MDQISEITDEFNLLKVNAVGILIVWIQLSYVCILIAFDGEQP